MRGISGLSWNAQRGHLLRTLGDEKTFWFASSIIFGIFAILKGLGKPYIWAATQAQLSYRHGMIKRGLLGAIYDMFGVHHYRPLSIIFFFQLLLFFILLIAITWRSGLVRRYSTPAVVAVFASSYVVTYLTQLVGYTDLVNATLLMCLLLVRNSTTRFLLGLAVVPLATLIHENFLILFLPILLFSFYINGAMDGSTRNRKKLAFFGASLFLLSLTTTFISPFTNDHGAGGAASTRNSVTG